MESKGLKIPAKGDGKGDGVELTAIAHPPGLIRKIAAAIRSGKLSLIKSSQ